MEESCNVFRSFADDLLFLKELKSSGGFPFEQFNALFDDLLLLFNHLKCEDIVVEMNSAMKLNNFTHFDWGHAQPSKTIMMFDSLCYSNK